MPNPGIITGNSSIRLQQAFNDPDPKHDAVKEFNKIYKDITIGADPEPNLGVFGPHPGSTAKYAFNSKTNARDAEYRESMARLYIELPSENARTRFLATVSEATKPLAEVLATPGKNGQGGTGFIDFLLTSANENFQEKAQIVDTLTDNYVAFYSGREPPVFAYSGVLLNTYQDDQRVWMWRLYQEIMRGTRLANRNLMIKLKYDSFTVSGYMESLNMALNGETEHTASQFQFTLRVKRMTVDTDMLALPTVSTTPAMPLNLVKKEEKNQRNMGSTDSVPPTATRGPAARQNNNKAAQDLAALSDSVFARFQANSRAVLARSRADYENSAENNAKAAVYKNTDVSPNVLAPSNADPLLDLGIDAPPMQTTAQRLADVDTVDVGT